MAAPKIQPENITTLSTVHENFKENIENLFTIWNGDNPDVIGGYNETTNLIQQFLADAIHKKKTVRALGGNWSWTKVGFAKHWVLNTMRLNRMKRILPTEIETANYPYVPDQLLFAQCGCSVQEISRMLRSFGRSLFTSGASNGQTIAGLISNGTHGAAIDYGSSTEFVVGLHIIVGTQKHVYLERASKPIVSKAFLQKIGAELIRDDALFNAALVSFGSFGFIHGVMIETAPLFLYNIYRQRFASNLIRPIMGSLDFSRASFLPKSNERPYHFQVVVNPYDTSQGYYVTVMYKRPYRNDYPPIVADINKIGPGDDAPVILGKLTTLLPVLTPLVVNQTLQNSYIDLKDQWGTHSEVFSTTFAQGKVLSTALGIPAEYSTKVLDIALDINRDKSFVGVLSFRYVKQSTATLGFTQFPHTCVAEFDSFEAPSTWRFFNNLWLALDKANIPYTFHWGKINNLNTVIVRKMYGKKVDEWIAARNRLLSHDMMQVFTNQFMIDLGLDKVLAPVV